MTYREIEDFARMNGLSVRVASQLLGEESTVIAEEARRSGAADPRVPPVPGSTGVPLPAFRPRPPAMPPVLKGIPHAPDEPDDETKP